jgi:predicted Zn-dependent protease
MAEIIAILFFSLILPGKTVKTKNHDLIVTAMREEINRAMTCLKDRTELPPYFIGYRLTDITEYTINSVLGALHRDKKTVNRWLDTEVRVGDHQLDNSRPLRGNQYDYNPFVSNGGSVSIEDDLSALKTSMWLMTDAQYKAAIEKYMKLKVNQAVNVEEEDPSPDFSRQDPVQYTESKKQLKINKKKWLEQLKNYSGIFKKYPDILSSQVNFRAVAVNKYIVNSEGTQLFFGDTYWELSIFAHAKAPDGMNLYKYIKFDSRHEAQLPHEVKIKTAINELIQELTALGNAPLMEPFTGPAILSGRAAGVFFHEIFGHRIEGHRQKDEADGQTFTKNLNQLILPEFITVIDDPTIPRMGEIDLNGFYLFDDQGVHSERVILVENGILKNFLMSRSPIKYFLKSNGHGRAEPGKNPVSRQGNLIVSSSGGLSEKALREALITECRKQGKEFGLFFADIAGGETSTSRYGTQSFNVTPIVVYKIFVNNTPDQLVRGVELIGTPLVSFSKIIACGDTPYVFNGLCGAESGYIPVSAIAPAILTAQIEVQKKPKGSEKLPILSSPLRNQPHEN